MSCLLFERIDRALAAGGRLVVLPGEVKLVAGLLEDFVAEQRRIVIEAERSAARAREDASFKAAILWRWRCGHSRRQITEDLACNLSVVARITAGVRRHKPRRRNWATRYQANRRGKS